MNMFFFSACMPDYFKKNITHIFACEHMWDRYWYTLFYDLSMGTVCSKGRGGKIKLSTFVEGLTYIICIM